MTTMAAALQDKMNMAVGLSAGIFFALDTVVLGLAMALPVYNEDLRIVFLAPYISNFLHFIFSAAVLGIYFGVKKQFASMLRSLWCRGGVMILLAAFLGGPVGMTAYVVAIHYIGPSFTAAISALFPALGAFFAYVFLKEKMGVLQLSGLAVSVAGVAILGFAPGTGDLVNAPVGFLFAMICCLGWALESVLFSYGFRRARITQGQALFFRQLLSAAVCGVIILPLLGAWEHTIQVIPDGATVYILLGALFLTASYLCYYRAILSIGATKAMALNITYTVWAIVFSVLLMHTMPDVKSVLCSTLILGGSLGASVNMGERRPSLKP